MAILIRMLGAQYTTEVGLHSQLDAYLVQVVHQNVSHIFIRS
jgi:hypothetical protein